MLAMMVDLEEDEDWALADELEDDDFDRYAPSLPPYFGLLYAWWFPWCSRSVLTVRV